MGEGERHGSLQRNGNRLLYIHARSAPACSVPTRPCLPTVGKTTERGNFAIISLGQGQEGPAERLLDTYVAEVNGWVLWSGRVVLWCKTARSVVGGDELLTYLCRLSPPISTQGGWLFLDNLQ